MEQKSMLGVMLDCSRNAVPNMSSAKHFIDCLEKMGYNTLMYYTEDTYEVENEPYFGYLRGRFSIEELRELDAYCTAHGIELIPCIQTLAHLNAIFRWQPYWNINDTGDILLTDDENTMNFLENIFRTLRKTFTSNRVHIGMDEAHMLGLGKYLDKHGFRNRTTILLEHLNKVCALADKYGFRPMMWSDMFFRLANHGNYYGELADEAAAEAKKLIPENLTLVYWDYYSGDPKNYETMCRGHKKLCDRTVFAGGVWTWDGFVPDNSYTLETTNPAVTVCRREGINDIFFTMWGDNGAECSAFAVLPTLFYAAELYRGNQDMASIKAKFNELFGEDFDRLFAMEKLDFPFKEKNNPGHGCSSKACLYNDILLGISDPIIADDAPEKYAALCREFTESAQKSNYFAPHFTYCAALADALSIKARLGIELRSAYKAGDREALTAICDEKLPAAEKAVHEFLKQYRKLWMLEKKPHGFDVQEIRIGGVITRLESAALRLREYLNGEVERIDELEETLLSDYAWNNWSRLATANVL